MYYGTSLCLAVSASSFKFKSYHYRKTKKSNKKRLAEQTAIFWHFQKQVREWLDNHFKFKILDIVLQVRKINRCYDDDYSLLIKYPNFSIYKNLPIKSLNDV